MGTADDLRSTLTTFLSAKTGGNVTVSDLKRFSGGASRETWSFRMNDGLLVLRRDPPGRPSPDRASELELLQRAHAANVPVPEVFWDGDADELGGGAGYVMEHIEGETIARKILRDYEFAHARTRFAAQVGEITANIHSISPDGIAGLVPPARPPTEMVLEQYRSLLDTFAEPHPALELGLRWLSERLPSSERSTIVHGDFRMGNLIVGTEGVRAVLDWELVHIGDPWEDLAWVCMRSWRFGGDKPVGGVGDREEFYAAYEKASGVPVDRDAVHWWEVMSSVKWGVMTIGQAFAHLMGHVSSLELAAIGRRTVENEYDVLNYLKAGAD
ncbi:MAG: phosphotransferase family protein [Actinomycetota bacterium]